MKKSVRICLLLAAVVACIAVAHSQQSFGERLSAHNYAMTALEPAWPSPIVECDPRLVQYYRFSFSNQFTPAGTQTVNYGNTRGGGIIAWNRVEMDWVPPAYIQHHSTALDGFGDTAVLVKYRIASANAQHGNYIVSALLNHTFATSPHNGALTDSWSPTVAGGFGFLKRMSTVTSLGGALPAGKIATQGRSIAWNALLYGHVSRPFWFEIENNATFYFAGSHDGKMQNFVTPAAYYVLKRAAWKPQHPYFVFDGGMQIATSAFHTGNHNTIAETRIIF